MFNTVPVMVALPTAIVEVESTLISLDVPFQLAVDAETSCLSPSRKSGNTCLSENFPAMIKGIVKIWEGPKPLPSPQVYYPSIKTCWFAARVIKLISER